MKMNYLPRNRSSSLKNLAKVTLIMTAILVVVGGFFGILRGQIVSFASLIWKSENRVSQMFASVGTALDSKGDLERENERLRIELERYRLERQVLANYSEREAELLALLGRVDETGGVPVGVLVHPPRSAYDSVIIDAGSLRGLEVGQRVILAEGVLLGELVDVYSDSALVRLYSTPGKKTNAILERGEVPVELTGLGGGNMEFSLPRDQEIALGDRVVSSGIASRLVAVVGEIELSPTDSHKRVLAQSPANIFSLRFVVVLP